MELYSFAMVDFNVAGAGVDNVDFLDVKVGDFNIAGAGIEEFEGSGSVDFIGFDISGSGVLYIGDIA